MDELKKYIIEAQVQQELIDEMNDSYTLKLSKENEYMKYKATKLVEGVLREFEMAVSGPITTQEDHYKDVDPRVKKSQTLVRILQDSLYKLSDSQKIPYNGDEAVDDDIKELMINNIEPLIKATIEKLKCIWEKESEPEKVVDKVEIITFDKLKELVGQEIKTPQNESLKIKEIMGDKIMLEDKQGVNKFVEKSVLVKWIKG